MKVQRHRVHEWAYRYGDARGDPWPGDLACVCGVYWYVFDGQYWRPAKAKGWK